MLSTLFQGNWTNLPFQILLFSILPVSSSNQHLYFYTYTQKKEGTFDLVSIDKEIFNDHVILIMLEKERRQNEPISNGKQIRKFEVRTRLLKSRNLMNTIFY